MLSRASVLATVTLLIGCLAGPATRAQAQNLEAGKSASQLFAGTCSACHKSPRGLLKTISAGSLTGFLREHYTTSGDMASQLSSYLISNGATDSRQARHGAGSDQQGRKQRGAPAQEAARPDVDARETGPSGHKRLARPGEAPEEAKPTPNGPPAQAAIERGSDGRKSKQWLSRRNRPEEAPAASEPKAEPAPGMNDEAKGDTAAKEEGARPEEPKAGEVKPGETQSNEIKPTEAKSEPAQAAEPPKETSAGEKPVMRSDQVPADTLEPPATSAPQPPAVASGGSTEPPAPRFATPAPSEPATPDAPAAATSAPSAAPAVETPPPAPAHTASAPPPAPAGPPISK